MGHFVLGVTLKGMFWSEFSGLSVCVNRQLKEEMSIKREGWQVKILLINPWLALLTAQANR